MNNNRTHLYILAIGMGTFPTVTAAQELGRLTAIPFVSESAGIGELVYGLYLLAIVIAATFAVVKLAIAGITYMTSDVVSSKESAKSGIKGAVLGLLLLLMTVLLVDLINPNIADTDISLPTVVGGNWRNVGGESPTYPGSNVEEREGDDIYWVREEIGRTPEECTDIQPDRCTHGRRGGTQFACSEGIYIESTGTVASRCVVRVENRRYPTFECTPDRIEIGVPIFNCEDAIEHCEISNGTTDGETEQEGEDGREISCEYGDIDWE